MDSGDDTGAMRTPDAQQRAVIALPADASGVVVGAPGTGKTTVLAERVAALLAGGVAGTRHLDADEIVVLTPTRQTATALRDRLGAGLDLATPGPLARSVASFAFQIVRAAAVAAGEPPPQLLTAGDQDRIIAELLAGDEQDAESGLGDRWPEAIGPALRGSRQFRAELRALAAECSERGISPLELAAVAEAYDRPVWTAASSFFREYRDTLGAMRTAHRDPAELVREAAGRLATAPAGDEGVRVLGPLARLRVVLVDDAQELTPGGLALLRALRLRGIAVLAFGDPDIGSGSFRGASPALFADLCDELGAVFVLDVPHRATPALTRLTRVATEAIGASGRVDHRRAPGPAVDDVEVTTIVAASPFEEIDRIARVLREWHVHGEVPWGRLAVIAHDTRQVAELEVELAAREVPTRAGALPRPLGGEGVVRELVQFVALGIQAPEERPYEALTAALLSPFGGLDAVSLRRLRARLRHAALREAQEPGAPPARAARELLCDAMAHPLGLSDMTSPEGRAAERVATTLARVHAEAERGAHVHELLWIVWDAARDISGRALSRVWAELAGSPGVFSAEANRALDALVALFDAAKRFVERAPQERPVVFIRRILDSAVPEDILTAPDRAESVAVLTPASALGTEFDGVVIAGLQDGVWPNVRLRGGTLGTWRLADDIAAWRAGLPEPVAPAVLDRRRAALHDELRLFVRAASRARTRLAVTAVDDDDLGPSPLLSFLPEPDADGGLAAAEAEHPLTLRGLVAQHRRTLTSVSGLSDARRRAAEQLAVLAQEGISGAAPDQWFGITASSSIGPLRDPDRAPVPVSPSKLTTFQDCALDWAIRALGGDTRSWSAGAGTILHAAMEDVPSGDLGEILQILDERWGELDFEADWLARKERTWADLLAERLHRYLTTFHAHEGTTLGAEARFRLAVQMDAEPGAVPEVRVVAPETPRLDGRFAVLSGSIDRVERYPPGRGEDVPVDSARAEASRVLIVDLKTGRSETRVSDDKVVGDPQLAAYQLALLEGLVPGADPADNAGARLIVLSKNTVKNPHYRLARQQPMGDVERASFLGAIVEAAHGMASGSFAAPVDAHCATSRFGVCALHTVKAVSAP